MKEHVSYIYKFINTSKNGNLIYFRLGHIQKHTYFIYIFTNTSISGILQNKY
jgi:hypothetical protein